MVSMQETLRPATHVADALKGSGFAYNADVHVKGDVALKRKLVVGGNLVVDGNLEAGEVYCCGEITVKGDVKATDIYAGVAIHAGGSIVASYIKTGSDPEHIAIMADVEDIDDNVYYIDKLVHPDIADNLKYEREQRLPGGYPSLTAGKYLNADLIEIPGDVEIGGNFDVDIASIGGLSAEYIHVEEDLYCNGYIDSRTDICVGGDFEVYCIHCLRNLYAENGLRAEGWIVVRGYILAGGDVSSSQGIDATRWIASSGKIQSDAFIKAGESIVSDKGVSAGKDYGILAGLSVPRSLWPSNGYISAPVKPHNILTGKFVAGKASNDLPEEEREIKLP